MGLYKATAVTPERITRLDALQPEVNWAFGKRGSWGLARGRIILITGERGCGKTRFLTELVHGWDQIGLTTMFCQGEVSVGQFVAEKFEKGIPSHCFLSDDMSIDDQISHIAATSPAVCITDSVQQIEEYKNGRGAKECVRKIRSVIGHTGTVMILISQMTTTGTARGGSELPHEVDTESYMKKWAPTTAPNLFCLEIAKNRYGPSGKEVVMCHRNTGVEFQSQNRLRDPDWVKDMVPVRRKRWGLF